jgi:hypothetical protein
MFDGEGNGDWCLVFGDAEEDLALRRFGVMVDVAIAELWDDLRKNDRFFRSVWNQGGMDSIRLSMVCLSSVCPILSFFFHGGNDLRPAGMQAGSHFSAGSHHTRSKY